ncbi:glycosyltransferase, partial [Glutamicibacter ardleyensis]|uniref:glycosyltransferase n=1 Tax=Glutamicibacter ardleyensis TaxID=225894 RepID=UPI003FD516A7
MIPERSLRIVLLANGASIHTIRWANIFAEKGHSVILVTEWNHVPAYGELDSQVQV